MPKLIIEIPLDFKTKRENRIFAEFPAEQGIEV
jgi:hypothetical protein